MTSKSASEVLAMIASHWNMHLDDERHNRIWLDYLETIDDVQLALDGIARLARDMSRRPTVSDLRAAIGAIRTDRRLAEPHEPRRAEMGQEDFKRDLPDWVKGWAVARYAERDLRVWPEQGPGYDWMQEQYPHTRTYVWGEQEQMPEEERAAYEQRGSHITSEKVGAILSGGVK